MPGVATLGPGIRPSGGTMVRSGDELQDALASARPGATILLAPGDFHLAGDLELAVPDVTLRASMPLRSTLYAPLVINGDRARIIDIAFRDQGDSNLLMVAVAACKDSITITSNDVEVRGCDFGYFPQRAIFVRSGLRPYIHSCTFHNNTKGGKNSNAHEAIALGYSNPNSLLSMRARVIGNRLWNLNIEGESISVKTSDNLIQNNQLSSSRGGFTQRYGRNNTFANNVFTNSRGIATGGRSARVIGNRVNGTGRIAIQAGDAKAESLTNGVHPQSADCVVEGNSGLLVIGNQYRPHPALRTVVSRHSGSIRLILHSGTKT